MTQSPLAIVRAWQEKSAEASIRCKDHLTSAIYKGFNAISAVLDKDSTDEDVQCGLEYLSSEITLSLKFDKSKDDSLRDLVYGLLESLHVSLNEWNEERNQRKEIGEISTQTEEYTLSFLGPIIPSFEEPLSMDNQTSINRSTLANPSHTVPIEAKEELIDIHHSLPQDYQISASELMRDEEMIMKEEMDNQYSDPISPDLMDGISTTADFTRSLLPLNPREEPRDQTVPQDNQFEMQSLLVPPPSIIPPQEAVPIGFVHLSENMSTMGNFTPSNPKIKKEEPMETQEVHNDIEINNRDSMRDDRPFEDHEYDNVMPPSDFMDNSMNFDYELSGDGDLILANPPNEVSMSSNDMEEDRQQHQIFKDGLDSLANDLIDNEGEEEEAMVEAIDTSKDTSNSVKVEKRKRSSRLSSRPMQYAESMDDSDDDGGPSMKKSRSDSTRKDDNKRKSIKGEDKQGSSSKKLKVSKENATDLECPECEFSTRNVGTWIIHLRSKHSTTPSLCNHGNITVIRKRDGPIGRFDDEKTTPQCVLCEVYPKTTYGYTHHLNIHHKSTLVQNGIYLMCSCGLKVSCHNSHTHLDECNPRQFTLHKLDDVKTTPQCVLCEAYPRTACGYAQHLYKYHKSTLAQNGIYLMCSCGVEVRSNNSFKHIEECDTRQFTLHKLDDE